MSARKRFDLPKVETVGDDSNKNEEADVGRRERGAVVHHSRGSESGLNVTVDMGAGRVLELSVG